MSPPLATGRRGVLGYLDDLLWLALVILLFPTAILLVGMPVAVLVRLIAETLQRW